MSDPHVEMAKVALLSLNSEQLEHIDFELIKRLVAAYDRLREEAEVRRAIAELRQDLEELDGRG